MNLSQGVSENTDRGKEIDMKRTLTFIAAIFIMASGAGARTWTNAAGKTLEADLVRVSGDLVYLKIARNGNIHSVPIASLSESDQTFIKKYQKDQADQQRAEELAKRRAKWLTDYDDVQAEAKKYNLPILLLYTAPQWCGYCQMLEENILKKREFEEYASRHLVLFLADFSEKSDEKRWEKKHPELIKNFPVKGFPTVYVIAPSGENLGKLVGCNTDWTPKDYLERLEKRIAKMK